MTIIEAKSVVHSEGNASVQQLCMVAAAFADGDENDITFLDLLALLRAASRFNHGNPALEAAAFMLHRKAKRPKLSAGSREKVLDSDSASWERYLREHNLLK